MRTTLKKYKNIIIVMETKCQVNIKVKNKGTVDIILASYC